MGRLLTLLLPDCFIPKVINKKLIKASTGAAGRSKIEEINGCQIKPEQFNISNAEHGSTYLLIKVSANCRLLGEK